MSRDIMVPKLAVMIPEHERANFTGGFLDALEFFLGRTLIGDLLHESATGHSVGIHEPDNDELLLLLQHYGSSGFGRLIADNPRWIRRGPEKLAVVADLNETQRPYSMFGQIVTAVANRRLNSLFLFDLDDNSERVVHDGDIVQLGRLCPTRLVERHILIGNALGPCVASTIFDNGGMRLP